MAAGPGARCGGGDASPVHGTSRPRTCRLACRHVPVSVSLRAAAEEKARSSSSSDRHSPSGCHSGVRSRIGAAPVRRREIFWGAHDVAGLCRGRVFRNSRHGPCPRRPGTRRAEHLARVQVPMLFLQGTRDALADLILLRPLCESLVPPATLHVVDGADHSFHVLKRSGKTDDGVLTELASRVAAWADFV